MMKLNEKLVQLRKQKKLTQAQVAEMIEVSRQAVSKWESGIAIPTTDKLKKLAELYQVSADYLLDNELEFSNDINTVEFQVQPIKKIFSGEKIKIALFAVGISVVIMIIVLGIIAYKKSNNAGNGIPVSALNEEDVTDCCDGEFDISW